MPNTLVQWFRGQYPERSRTLSDDEITEIYASGADAYKQSSGTDIFSAYPDFAEDYHRITSGRAMQSVPALGKLKHAAGSFAAGVTDVVGDVPVAGARALSKVTAGDIDVTDPFIRAKKAASEFFIPDAETPEQRQALDESWTTGQVPRGLGSVGGFVATGGVLGRGARMAGLGESAAGVAGVAASGAASGFNQEYEKAKKAGLSDSKAFEAGLLGAGVGASEIVPVSRFLAKLEGVVPGVGTKIGDMVFEMFKEGGEEFLQEGFQSGAGNAIAQEIIGYDKDGHIGDEVASSAGLGGLTGAIASFLTSAVTRNRAQVAATPPPPPPPPAGTTTPPPPQSPPQAPPQAGTVPPMPPAGAPPAAAPTAPVAPPAVPPTAPPAVPPTATPPSATASTPPAGTPPPAAAPAGIDPEVAAGSAADVLQAQYDIDIAGIDDLITREVVEGEDVSAELDKLTPDQKRTYEQRKQDAIALAVQKIEQESQAAAAAGETTTTTNAEGVIPNGETEIETVSDEGQGQGQGLLTATNPESGQATTPPPGSAETPAPEAVATAPSSPSDAIRYSAKAFQSENKGEDSAKYFDEQATEAGAEGELMKSFATIIGNAQARYKAEKAEFDSKGGAGTPPPILNESEIGLLDVVSSSLTKGKQFGDTTVPAFMVAAKAGQITSRGVEVMLDVASRAYGNALVRKQRAEAAAQHIKESGSATAEHLVNVESINFTPKDASVPGYWQIGDGSDAATRARGHTSAYSSASTEEDKENAANSLGKFLTTGFGVSKSRAATRRLTVWQAKDGHVIVTSSFALTGKGREAANKAWAFSVAPLSQKHKGGSNLGIRTMLDAGYTPVASIAMAAPRGRVALHFDSLAGYDQFIGSAARDMAASVRRSQERREDATVKDGGQASILQDKSDHMSDSPTPVSDPEGDSQVKVIDQEKGDYNPSDDDIGFAFGFIEQNRDLVLDIIRDVEANPGKPIDRVVFDFAPRLLSRLDGVPAGELAKHIGELEGVLERLLTNERTRQKFQEAYSGGSGGVSKDVHGGEPAGEGGSDGGVNPAGGDPQAGAQDAVPEVGGEGGAQAGEAAADGGTAEVASAEAVPSVGHEDDASAARTSVLKGYLDNGLISAAEYEDALSDLSDAADATEADDVVAVYTEFARERQAKEDEKADPNQEELSSLSDKPGSYRLLPISPENARLTIDRHTPKVKPPAAQAGLLGTMSLGEIKSLYPNIGAALRTVAEGTSGFTHRISTAMANAIHMTGAELRFMTDPTANWLAHYDLKTGVITINLSKHRDIGDLHVTILHEAIHAFVDRIRLRAMTDASSVTKRQLELINQLEAVMAKAKAAGIEWQQSGETDPRVVFSEFLAAVGSDRLFQEKLSKTPDGDRSLWQRIKEAISKMLVELVHLFAPKATPSISFSLGEYSGHEQVHGGDAGQGFEDESGGDFGGRQAGEGSNGSSSGSSQQGRGDVSREVVEGLRRDDHPAWSDPRVLARELGVPLIKPDDQLLDLPELAHGFESKVLIDAGSGRVLKVVDSGQAVGISKGKAHSLFRIWVSNRDSAFVPSRVVAVVNDGSLVVAQEYIAGARHGAGHGGEVDAWAAKRRSDLRRMGLFPLTEYGNSSISFATGELMRVDDLNLSNLVYDQSGNPYIIDFITEPFTSKQVAGFLIATSISKGYAEPGDIPGDVALPALKAALSDYNPSEKTYGIIQDAIDAIEARGKSARTSAGGSTTTDVGEASDETLLGQAEDFLTEIVRSYDEATSTADKLAMTGDDGLTGEPISYRHVDGWVGEGGDISVDRANVEAASREARQVLASVNEVDDAVKAMHAAWAATPSGRSSMYGTFVQDMVNSTVRGATGNASEVRTAVADALAAQRGNPVDPYTKLSSLEQHGEAPTAARTALRMLNRVLTGMTSMRAEAKKAFADGLLARLAIKNTELTEVLNRFEDITILTREFTKELRRGLTGNVDKGAFKVASDLGVTNPTASVKSAIAAIQGNLNNYMDAVQALAEIRIDFAQVKSGAIKASDVKAAVAASPNPKLALLRANDAALAVAIMFGRRRPLVMDLMAARTASGTERKALKDVIAIATSTRPDAHDAAVADLGKLKTLGAIGARVAVRIRETRIEHARMLADAKRYAEFVKYADLAEPVLMNRIRDLERFLEIEGHTNGYQWQAVDGSVYYAPKDPKAPESEVFVHGSDNANRHVLKFGDSFNWQELFGHIQDMTAWLAANPGLRGTPNYRLIERQRDKLTKVYADGANFQIQRGVGGIVMRYLGDIATRSDRIGTQAMRVFSQQVRRFVALYESGLNTTEKKKFEVFDRLGAEASKATGQLGMDFWQNIYNRALGFLEHQPGLLDAKLTDAQQLDKSLKAALDALEVEVPHAMTRPGARAAVEKLLRQAVECQGSVFSLRKNMNLKVREDITKDGRVIFREPIGNPAHTMSRRVSRAIRDLVAVKMSTGWNSEFTTARGKKERGLSTDVVADLYRTDRPKLASILAERFTPEVLDHFAKPLVYKSGKSNFNGPSQGGVVDTAQRSNVIDAFNLSGGDMIVFAETLYQLEAGAGPVDPAFVGSTLATFQAYYNNVLNIAAPGVDKDGVRMIDEVDDGAEVARSFLDARQGDDFPHEWLDYRRYGRVDFTRYVRLLALQAAFGDGAKAAVSNLNKAKEELGNLAREYNEAQKLPPAEKKKALDAGGLRKARENAQKNLNDVRAIEDDYVSMVKTSKGVPQDERLLMSMVGVMAGATVQGITTSATDTVSMVEAPLRKFGLSKEAMSFIGGSWKNFGFEVLGSMFQAFGAQLTLNAGFAKYTRILNSGGAADVDAQATARGPRYLAQRYAEMVGDQATLAEIRREFSGQPLRMAAAIARGTVARAIAAARVALSAGVGVAKNPDGGFVTLKVLAPFSMNSLWMHRAVSRQWMAMVEEATRAASEYMKAHPADAADPNFRFNPKTLGFARSNMLRDQRAFDYFVEALAQNGITLEEAGRRGARGVDPLTEEDLHSVAALAQTEILLGTTAATRPQWSMNHPVGRIASPLVGWSLYKMVDVGKTFRTAKGQAELKAFSNAMVAFALGVLPANIIYAFLRDWYDEEVLGKKGNVLPMRLNADLPMALLSNLNRIGTFGMAGEVADSLINVSTSREFTIDSRVFFANSLASLGRVVKTIYRQDFETTYASTWRPLMQAVGGAGYLSNFDAINNLLGFDNQERRYIRRINVSNQLRSVGREAGLDVRVSRGLASMPTAMKAHVSDMALAAYGNDATAFQRAYIAALEAANRQILENPTPDADPRAQVAEAYERMHPLRSVFDRAPSKQEYQKMLGLLGDNATEVSAAIRNFNSYGAQVPKGRGKPGIPPFYGTDRPTSTTRPSYTSGFSNPYKASMTQIGN